jgi:rhodanese-related sulfurtransferase
MNQICNISHRKMMKYSVIILVTLMITSSVFASIFKTLQPKPVLKTISTVEAVSLIKENTKNTKFVILDVRTPAEYAEGHIANATNIDFKADDFAQNVSKLDKSRKYLIYCRSGHRSGLALEVMKTQLFETVYNIDGGISKWTSDNNPVVK